MIKSFVSVFRTKFLNQIPYVHSIFAIMKFQLIYNIPILIWDMSQKHRNWHPSRMIWWNQATMHEGTRVDSVIAALSADIIYHNLRLSCGQQSRVMKLEKEIGRREATWCSLLFISQKLKSSFFPKNRMYQTLTDITVFSQFINEVSQCLSYFLANTQSIPIHIPSRLPGQYCNLFALFCRGTQKHSKESYTYCQLPTTVRCIQRMTYTNFNTKNPQFTRVKGKVGH